MNDKKVIPEGGGTAREMNIALRGRINNGAKYCIGAYSTTQEEGSYIICENG